MKVSMHGMQNARANATKPIAGPIGFVLLQVNGDLLRV